MWSAPTILEEEMNEIRVNLVIYYLQTKTHSFLEALKMAKSFMGESNENII